MAPASYHSLGTGNAVVQTICGKVKIDGAYVQFLRNRGSIEKNLLRFPSAFEEKSAVTAEGDEDESE